MPQRARPCGSCASSTVLSSRHSEKPQRAGGRGTSRPASPSTPSRRAPCPVTLLEFFDTIPDTIPETAAHPTPPRPAGRCARPHPIRNSLKTRARIPGPIERHTFPVPAIAYLDSHSRRRWRRSFTGHTHHGGSDPPPGAPRHRWQPPRVHAKLRARGRRISEKRVARLMRQGAGSTRKAPGINTLCRIKGTSNGLDKPVYRIKKRCWRDLNPL